MIFPGFPGVLSFFQVFQVEWEPCPDMWPPRRDLVPEISTSTLPPPPQSEQIDRNLWKHYLPATAVAGGNDHLIVLCRGRWWFYQVIIQVDSLAWGEFPIQLSRIIIIMTRYMHVARRQDQQSGYPASLSFWLRENGRIPNACETYWLHDKSLI